MAITKRLYICKIVGDGLSVATARRPAISLINDASGNSAFNVFCEYAVSNGMLKLPWAIVLASGADHTLAANNVDVDPMPAVPMTTLLVAMPAAVAAAKAKLSARGVDVVALFAGASTYGDVVRALLHLHGSSFTETSFE